MTTPKGLGFSTRGAAICLYPDRVLGSPRGEPPYTRKGLGFSTGGAAVFIPRRVLGSPQGEPPNTPKGLGFSTGGVAECYHGG